MKSKANTLQYHLMLLPCLLLLCVFSLYPLMGSVLAFKTFKGSKGIWGSPWAGFENFQLLFSAPKFYQILFNTVYLSVMKILFGLMVPLVFALLLNEVQKRWYRNVIQTTVFLPYFLSWVILAGIFKDIFSTSGLVNRLMGLAFGTQPVMFFADNRAFPSILIFSDTWKNYGFNVIIFLAALTSIDPTQYEAARIDGASRWKQLLYVTLPSLLPTIILLAALSMQNVLNAGFDQILNMYNPLVYQSA
ncbi:MAG TPA: ABC transporter permease subunit, partial [Clostridia bacterium]|nr:ABC transporter permease subunit [Clostridia bacterium]